MKRTIEEIKKEITDSFIKNTIIIDMYELDKAKTFDQQFSKASLEGIIFYIVACSIWVVENLFDILKTEIRGMLDLRVPHTLKWYQNKVLRFQYSKKKEDEYGDTVYMGEKLVEDKDYYDNSGLTEDQIKELEIIKFCAIDDLVTELRVKVATEDEEGQKRPLDEDKIAEEDKSTIKALQSYLEEIKDAGVKIVIISQEGDNFFLTVDVYYNPLFLNPLDKRVEKKIKQYIGNLPFNSTLSTTKLTDAIQEVDGVELVEIISCKVKRGNYAPVDLGVQKIADSGYFVVDEDEDLKVNYKLYTHENL